MVEPVPEGFPKSAPVGGGVGESGVPEPRDSVVDIESWREAELILLLESPSEELMVRFSARAGRPAVSGGTILTTLTP